MIYEPNLSFVGCLGTHLESVTYIGTDRHTYRQMYRQIPGENRANFGPARLVPVEHLWKGMELTMFIRNQNNSYNTFLLFEIGKDILLSSDQSILQCSLVWVSTIITFSPNCLLNYPPNPLTTRRPVRPSVRKSVKD